MGLGHVLIKVEVTNYYALTSIENNFCRKQTYFVSFGVNVSKDDFRYQTLTYGYL